MKYSLFLIAASIVMSGLVSCNTNNPNDQEEEITIISAISAERAKAFNEGNASGIAIHFTDDAHLMAPDAETKRGKAAIQAYYQEIFDTYHCELESGYEAVKVDGDLAYGRGFAKVILTPKNGGEKIYATSKYLNILEKQADGTWLTTHDIWNGNQ